jgi:hypothetical protein
MMRIRCVRLEATPNLAALLPACLHACRTLSPTFFLQNFRRFIPCGSFLPFLLSNILFFGSSPAARFTPLVSTKWGGRSNVFRLSGGYNMSLLF